MTAFPPTIRSTPGQPVSSDPAKYLIQRTRFVRPSLRVAPNGPEFEWPIGVEGIRVTGQVGVAQHLYLGDNAPVVQVVHRDARQIEMRGSFLGFTASQNLRDLLAVVTAAIPQGYWILRLPASIFPREQTVVIQSYDFDHPEDDRNQSWSYFISFVRTGVGGAIQDQTSSIVSANTVGNVNTINSPAPRGQANQVFITRSGANTLRLVASIVYGDPSKWRLVYDKNKQLFSGISAVQVQYLTLQPGMKLNV